MPTLLHLSDLHRTSGPRLQNDELLAALMSDAQRWRTEGIPDPDIVVVSGDLIQGAGLDDPDADAKIAAQYAEVHEFLLQLAQHFVNSDLSRVVIVPGNHDVHWGRARNSMTQIATCPPDIAVKQLKADSRVRWDWEQQLAYEISDSAVYDARLSDFRNFQAEFYAGLDPSPLSQDGTDLVFFEHADLGLAVVGFASWYGNDCFCHVGDIAPTSLAKSRQLLSNSQAPVAVAVWHHSINGKPQANDYMDQHVIHKLVDFGFTVGLHGHQHYPEAAPYEVKLPNLTSMAVVCAGSLAVGDRELPMGEPRQFNIVEIDIEDKSIVIHVRAMSPAGVFFGSHRNEFGGNTYTELTLPTSITRRQGPTTTQLLDQAFTAVAINQFEEAVELANQLPANLSSVKRQIRIKALEGLGCLEDLIALLDPPENAAEVYQVVSLLLDLHRFDEAEQRLQDASAAIEITYHEELAAMIAARRIIS